MELFKDLNHIMKTLYRNVPYVILFIIVVGYISYRIALEVLKSVN